MDCVLAIDQSTTATKALLFSDKGRILRRADVKHRQLTNERGWIGHDADEILENTLTACRRVLEGGDACVRAVGITNQRETTVCWDRDTGRPLSEAIVWHCPRAAEITKDMQPEAARIREITGLRLSPFFSAPKMAWIQAHCPEAARLKNSGRLCFGTVDSWLVYSLTRERTFATECSNASRTMLMDLDTLDWNEGLLSLFGLDRGALPQIWDSDACFGRTDLNGLLPEAVPVLSVLGDSQAALLAQGCTAPGAAKVTFGTGASVMMNAGAPRTRPLPDGLVESCAWRIGGETDYVIEGNINYAGAIASWLVDNVQLLEDRRQIGELAASVPDTGGVCFVPAFSGLGAPYWLDGARAMISGMHAGTKRAHILRAAEEAVAYQIHDIIAEMDNGRMPVLCADGGATNDAFLMQFTADVLQKTIRISDMDELSAAGVADLALVRAGLSDRDTIRAGRTFRLLAPRMEPQRASRLIENWRQAVNMLKK